MKTIAKLIGIFALLSLLSACGGGSASFTGGGTGSTGGGGTSTTPTGITLTLTSNLTTLSAGGSTGLVASLVDSTGAPYTTQVAVSFSSICTGTGLAAIVSPVTTNNGVANTTYTDKGCGSTDTITATAVVNSVTLTKSTTVTVTPATVGSIEFVSATPTTMAVQGTGGTTLSETSTVVFRVKNSAGGPRYNAAVTFGLTTTAGGITLSANTGTSDANGLVTTVVKSGTVHTSVWVTAVYSPTIQTQSTELVISTGVPSQDRFRISLATLNPEVWGTLGVEDLVTVSVADRYNNPAPDGTTVAFTAEGGVVTGSCQTVDRLCTVKWTSGTLEPVDGRVTILATASGEESFTDTNGNGRYDSGEPFGDLPEAYRDDNENGIFESGTEPFLDFNNDHAYSIGDTKFTGVLCNSGCSTSATSVDVRSSVVLVMAASAQLIFAYPPDLAFTNPADPNTDPTCFDHTVSGFDPTQVGCTTSGPIILPSDKSVVTVDLYTMDARGQVPPAGTVISATTTNGVLLGGTSFTMPNTAAWGPYHQVISLQADDTLSTGILTIKATTPKGLITTRIFTVTEKDVVGPTVTTTAPAGGTTGVSKTLASITATFSEAIDPATANTTNFTITGGAGTVSGVTYNAGTKTVTMFLDPATPLDGSKLYTVTVKKAVTDTAGNHLNGTSKGAVGTDETWIFQTAP